MKGDWKTINTLPTRSRQLRFMLATVLAILVPSAIVTSPALAQSQGSGKSSMEGNIGGFGAGSDFAWQLWPMVGVDVGKHASLGIGYRILSMDYDTGSGDQLFKYDVTTQAIVLGGPFSSEAAGRTDRRSMSSRVRENLAVCSRKTVMWLRMEPVLKGELR